MRIYCKYSQIAYISTLTSTPLLVNNHAADVDDEVGAQLVLNRPGMFRARPWETHELIETVYNADPDRDAADQASEASPVDPPVDGDSGGDE